VCVCVGDLGSEGGGDVWNANVWNMVEAFSHMSQLLSIFAQKMKY